MILISPFYNDCCYYCIKFRKVLFCYIIQIIFCKFTELVLSISLNCINK